MSKTEPKANKKSNRIYYLFAFLCVIIIVCIFNQASSTDVSNAKCAKAIVIDDFYGVRYTDYFSYVFIANDTVYKGSGHYYKDSDAFSVGDTVTIVYDSNNPDNNIPLRSYNKAIDCSMH